MTNWIETPLRLSALKMGALWGAAMFTFFTLQQLAFGTFSGTLAVTTLLIWTVCGAAFGLVMKYFARRHDRLSASADTEH